MSKSGSEGLKKGPWTPAEDRLLVDHVRRHGEGSWNAVRRETGLQRCGKSCRLRWANHLRPNLRKGPFTPDEERLILRLHGVLGNKWARISSQVRTDAITPAFIFFHLVV
jgi:myb proto-oncogene protein